MAINKNYMLNDKFPKAIKNATSTSDGLMSARDKSRIDTIFESDVLSPATHNTDGLMTKEDKAKLDALPTKEEYDNLVALVQQLLEEKEGVK